MLSAKSGEPLFMGKGRNGECLEAFFMSLTQEQRQGILYLGIDRSNTYRSVALRCLPNVKICYGPYHLVSNMNGVVDDVRRSVMTQATKDKDEALKKVVVNTRYLLPSAPQKLDAPGRLRLDQPFAINHKLNVIYMLKEQFRAIFRQREENAAMLGLIDWIRMATASKVKRLVDFAMGIWNKFNEIINSFRYHINSARIESMNAEINRIQARCCGLFDLRYLFLKLRQSSFLRAVPFYVKPILPHQQI